MEPTGLVLAAVALGLVVGGGFVAVLLAAAGRGARASSVAAAGVPDGVEQILDVLESAGVVLDPSNNVVKASEAAHGLGIVWNGMLARPELVELVDRVRRTGEPEGADQVLSRGPFGDASIHLHARAAPLGARFILMLAEDRTESVRVEEVRRDFLANISHELKTPIASVGLLAEALEQVADEPDQVRHFTGRLTVEAERLGRITQDIIELSRLQSANPLGDMGWVPLDRILTTAVEQNRVTAEASGIRLTVAQAPQVELYASEPVLITAVHNLVVNAIQHSPEDARISVAATVADGVAEIAVTDTGDGIPAESLDRIFERFYRVDDDRSRRTGGTGLGLSIVRHAVSSHGGEVRVWSQQGTGSTFTIRLPLSRRSAAPVPTDDGGGR